MKVVILAGGFGTRISEESTYKPKPMVEIGEKPIIWHIMKLYSHYGFNDFIICAGYKQEVIKEWFANYYLHNSDVTFDFTNGCNDMQVHNKHCESWKVTIVDTGLHTMTGGRIKRIRDYLGDSPFFLTYGDGVSNINLKKELEFHKAHGKLVTLSCYNPGQRFGMIDISDDGRVIDFREKIDNDGNLVNIGYMICNTGFIDYIDSDQTILEQDPLKNALKDEQLMAFRHEGFWQSMDTVREKQKLEELWGNNAAPWKIWED